MRRKRAYNDLAALDAQSVDVSDLPSAPRKKRIRSRKPRALRQAAWKIHPWTMPDGPGREGGAPTIVRSNPFGDDTDADRSKLLTAKANLQQKVKSGQATDRDLKMLRTVCKQLADVSCSN